MLHCKAEKDPVDNSNSTIAELTVIATHILCLNVKDSNQRGAITCQQTGQWLSVSTVYMVMACCRAQTRVKQS